jgi:cellulose synthase/poly-beta-1,6-N-acetylglucosamine synthase-like glycosyltransferase
LNFALSKAKGEIVAVIDADNVPEKDMLRRAACYFEDENTVAIQGATYSINSNQNLLTRLVSCEEATWLRTFVQGKSNLGLFVPFTGSCAFVRRAILERLGGWDVHSVAEDVELAARMTAVGFKVRFARDVHSRQESVSSIPKLVRQRVRWFRGYMETCVKYGWSLMKTSRLSLDAEVTLAGPYMMSLCAAAYLIAGYSFFFQPSHLSSVPAAVSSASTMLTAGVFIFLGGIWLSHARPLRWKDALLVAAIYPYWVLLSLVALYSLLCFALRRPRSWEKTEKTGKTDTSRL